MHNIKYLSHNINSDGRVSLHPCFKKWSLSERINFIIEGIKEENHDIVSLFEISAEFLNSVVEGLRLLDYDTTYASYSPNQYPDRSFYYVIAYKKKILAIKQYMFWFTNTPFNALTTEQRDNDKVLLNVNEKFEKGSFISVFNYNGFVFAHVSLHLGLRKPYQEKCVRMLIDHLKIYGDLPIIVSGDMNTFDDFVDGETDTVSLFKKDNFTHCQHDKTFTFIGYPYDLGAPLTPEIKQKINDTMEKFKLIKSTKSDEEIRKFFGKSIIEIHGKPIMSILDHVFIKGIDDYQITIDDKNLCSLSPEELNNEFIKNGLNKPLTLSDHFPLTIRI